VLTERRGSSDHRRASLGQLQRRRLLVTASVMAFLLGLDASRASALPYLPPPGKIFAGETGQPVSQYMSAVGKHPAVYQEFLAWG
jgi:hypothetical protein